MTGLWLTLWFFGAIIAPFAAGLLVFYLWLRDEAQNMGTAVILVALVVIGGLSVIAFGVASADLEAGMPATIGKLKGETYEFHGQLRGVAILEDAEGNVFCAKNPDELPARAPYLVRKATDEEGKPILEPVEAGPKKQEAKS